LCYLQERLSKGEPAEDDKRTKEFEKNRQIMVDIVTKIVRYRRGEGGSSNLEGVPFVDSLLQNYTSEDAVCD